jgi:hypothetical protein
LVEIDNEDILPLQQLLEPGSVPNETGKGVLDRKANTFLDQHVDDVEHLIMFEISVNFTFKHSISKRSL